MGKINQAWFLAQPRYSRKGRGASSKQSARLCSLPMGSLTLSGEYRMESVLGAKVEGVGGAEGSETGISM